jgi:6,7-dimethyl-8-ribityllumazine synthase
MQKNVQTQNVDAVIAIGCDSRETKHFDFVCEGVSGNKRFECSNGYSCYCTDNTMQQSIGEVEEFMAIKDRAAIAAIKMAFIRQQASLTHQKEIKRLLPTGRCG